MLSLLITLIVLAAICAVLWWAIGALALPEPVRIVAICIMVILVLVVLCSLLPGGGLQPFPLRRY